MGGVADAIEGCARHSATMRWITLEDGDPAEVSATRISFHAVIAVVGYTANDEGEHQERSPRYAAVAAGTGDLRNQCAAKQARRFMKARAVRAACGRRSRKSAFKLEDILINHAVAVSNPRRLS